MRETDEEAALLGRIAVRFGFITMEQLAAATQERGRGGKKLGAIMLEQGMLDELQLGKVLALQKRHRDALKSKTTTKKKVTRKRIPTPKDWAFEAPRSSRSQGSLPRRERRTADVMRAHLDNEEVPRPPAKPRPITLDSPRDVHVPPERPATTRKEGAAKESAFRKRPTAPTQPQARSGSAERDNATEEQPTASGDDEQRGNRRETPTPPTPQHHGRGSANKATAPDLAAARQKNTELPATPRESPTAKGRIAPKPPGIPEDALEVTLSESGALDLNALVDEPDSAPIEEVSVATAPKTVSTAPRISLPPSVSIPPAPPANLEPLPWTPPEDDNPKVVFLKELLTHAVSSHASDVHVHAGVVARMRQLGQLVPITEEPLAAEATLEALTAILTPWQRQAFEEAGEIDFAYHVEGLGRFRANVYQQQNGANGVFHIIPDVVPSLTSLGLPQALAKLTNYNQGLILITGPAGCGKTSTLAALTDIINEERTDHILTIEDPIEYVFKSKRCIVNQRQVGRHTESFATGLRGALREDPDIICIGELRDLETISLALSAAETGHLVLATVHTGSAIGTLNRIVGAYPPGQQGQVRAMMSESLRAITSQRLLPGLDGTSHVALETLFITRAVGALIRDDRAFQIGSIMQTGKNQGQRMLDDSLRDLLASKTISKDVALANCLDPRRLEGN